MKPGLGVSLLAIAAGLLIALLKVAGSFGGAAPFFGTDVLVCFAVAMFASVYPNTSRRWALLIGVPVLVPVVLFVVVTRARALDFGIGLAWLVSLLTTSVAAVIGSVLGVWIARRREQLRSGDTTSGGSPTGSNCSSQ